MSVAEARAKTDAGASSRVLSVGTASGADGDFGRGAAISLLMLAIVAAMSVFYVRKMVRIGDVE